MKLSRRIETLTAWRRALKSGLALDRCFELLVGGSGSEAENRAFTDLARRVREGAGLEANRGALVELYGEAAASLLVAGERSGSLEAMLSTCLGLAEARRDLRRKLGMALAYPAALFLFALLLMPLPTLAAHGVGYAVTHVYLPLGLSLAALALAALGLRGVWRGRGPARLAMERGLLKLPLLGGLLRGAGSSLFFSSLGAGLEGGIAPGLACEAACRASGLEVLAGRARELGRRVDDGTPLSAALPGAGFFPPAALKQVALGEETGDLPALLRAQAELDREALSRSGTGLAVLVGVGALLLVGLGVVAFVVSFWTNHFSRIGAAG